ncbi:hypothetical protein EUX98_g3040 [Antrodiella citrinella]|uniref:AAA+ ATPase domain-containing protein n=1 Tax=Antrodiella citrinella TaxID=2447956 RepID=A0A4V3XJ03_9APHY|nr:hypothetical protein EUX98_g3040 [Antrodiella citrinella]
MLLIARLRGIWQWSAADGAEAAHDLPVISDVSLKHMPAPILEVKAVGCSKAKGQPILSDASFVVNEGDIIILQGKSGCGKSTLLKCLAHLNQYDGEILYRGGTPVSYGIANYRTRVLYVPQRPSLLPGTPRDFVNTILAFKSLNPKSHHNKGNEHRPDGPSDPVNDSIFIAQDWGIDEDLWDRNWSNLSGGESQRIALSIAVGLKTADILLLDEPTSALDAESSKVIENYLTNARNKVDE